MAKPDQTVTRFDLAMGYNEFNLRANRQKFVGLKLFTPLPVGVRDATFRRIKIESLLGPAENTKRETRSGYSRGQFKWHTDSYNLEDHGVEEELDDEETERWSDIIRAEQLAGERAIDRVIRAHENDVKNIVEAWAQNTTVANPWDTANGTPIDDILTAIYDVKGRTAQRPNTFEITDWGWQQLSRADQFVTLIKDGKIDMPVSLTKQNFLEYFEFEDLLISDGYTNNQGENVVDESPDLATIWDPTKAFVCCVEKEGGMNGDLQTHRPHIGRTLFEREEMPAGLMSDSELAQEPALIMEEYYDPELRCSIIRARNHRQLKTMEPKAGQRLNGVTS